MNFLPSLIGLIGLAAVGIWQHQILHRRIDALEAKIAKLSVETK